MENHLIVYKGEAQVQGRITLNHDKEKFLERFMRKIHVMYNTSIKPFICHPIKHM